MRKPFTNLVGTCLIALSTYTHGGDEFVLEFIGEAQLPTGLAFKGVEVGGLSGIDYDPGQNHYWLISDDRADKGPARFYKMAIELKEGQLAQDAVTILEMKEIFDRDDSHGLKGFEKNKVDPEAIRLSPSGEQLFWTSEGNANDGVAPLVRAMDLDGYFLKDYPLPDYYLPTKTAGVRANLALESLSLSISNKFLIAAVENALVQDGPKANAQQGSLARVLFINRSTGELGPEFIYPLDKAAKPSIPPGVYESNGLVELLAIDQQRFITIERSFSFGVGVSVKLFISSIEGATDVNGMTSIVGRDIEPMDKHLLLDLMTLGIPLDNLEGITFGPTMPSGEKTLILVSDNNFNALGGQFTQFLAFTLVTTKTN